jgi:Winged helix-turn helix
MSKAQLVITAVVLEGRSKSQVARDYELSRYWVHQLVSRYHADGVTAFEPRSRRPHHHRHAVSAEVEDTIVRLRKSLCKQGYDAGGQVAVQHFRLLAALKAAAAYARRTGNMLDADDLDDQYRAIDAYSHHVSTVADNSHAAWNTL